MRCQVLILNGIGSSGLATWLPSFPGHTFVSCSCLFAKLFLCVILELWRITSSVSFIMVSRDFKHYFKLYTKQVYTCHV